MSVAFFDVDRTIVDGSTTFLAAQYLHKHNMLPLEHAAKSFFYFVLRKFRFIEYEKLYSRIIELFIGSQESFFRKMGDAIFNDMIQERIFQEAYNQILIHKSKGHKIVLITGGFTFLIEPLKDFLNIDHAFAVCPKIQDGILTGHLLEPLPYGGKWKEFCARQFVEEHGKSLDDAYFYGDSKLDISLLSRVGNPFAVNPDKKLQKYALKNNIPILSFRHRISG